MSPAVASVYWYVGRGPWRSSKLGDWDADGLSFSTAEWIDKHQPAGELQFRGARLFVYEHPKGALAVPAGPAARRAAKKSASSKPGKLSAIDLRALQAMKRDGYTHVGAGLFRTFKQAKATLERLVRRGLAVAEAGEYGARYRLTSDGRDLLEYGAIFDAEGNAR